MVFNNGFKTLDHKTICLLIGFTLVINAILLFNVILPNHDPSFYATMAKHIAQSNDWVNLIFNHVDSLDKPHFPFWVTAVFFKFFGISSFAYILPGFLFHLIGACYTYLLAKHLLNKEIALLSVLFYVTALHLMLSDTDVKAEAYLLGEIMPACYYWMLYQESQRIKFSYLFLGAFFTALAMMTKGIFVLVTIGGGFIALAINDSYQGITKKHPLHLSTLKWFLACILSFIFILPELVTLYLQFDAHPEKLVFGHTNVSGLKWYFWDSQLGRFFQTGPIKRDPGSFHYLYFVHTFLWAFLPWTIFFIIAFFSAIKSLCLKSCRIDSAKRRAAIFLLGSFIPTFCMFSISSFQLDHYTNIIIPFAAILSASWIYDSHSSDGFMKHVFNAQIILSAGIIIFLIVLDYRLWPYFPNIEWMLLSLVFIIYSVWLQKSGLFKAIVYPVFAINMLFVSYNLITHYIYSTYDAGYKIANYLNQQPRLPIIEYKPETYTLGFHSKESYTSLNDLPELLVIPKPYYLIIKKDDFLVIKEHLGHYQIVLHTKGVPFLTKTFKVITYLSSVEGLTPYLSEYLVVQEQKSV